MSSLSSRAIIEIPLENAKEALCYPMPFVRECRERLAQLKEFGITSVVPYGRFQISRNLRVVGKGHAAVVVLAKHKVHGLVALKVRRFDSKRPSLEDEGKILEVAHVTQFVPKPFTYTRDFIIREYIDGPTLGEYITMEHSAENLRKLFVTMIRGFSKLDLLGIDVFEISKPLTQIIIEDFDPSKPKLVDLESARITTNATSLTRFLGFLAKTVNGSPMYARIGLTHSDWSKLLSLAREYKRAGPHERAEVVEKILELFGS